MRHARHLTFDDHPRRAPSHAIRLALAALVSAEKDPRYRVGLRVFVGIDDTGGCRVCVAGALMASALGWPEPQVLAMDPPTPGDYVDADATVLEFVDAVARGNTEFDGCPIVCADDEDEVDEFDRAFDTGVTKGLLLDLFDGPLADAVAYDADPDGYRRWLSDVADWLEDRGY